MMGRWRTPRSARLASDRCRIGAPQQQRTGQEEAL
jgi:hypothetical protein